MSEPEPKLRRIDYSSTTKKGKTHDVTLIRRIEIPPDEVRKGKEGKREEETRPRDRGGGEEPITEKKTKWIHVPDVTAAHVAKMKATAKSEGMGFLEWLGVKVNEYAEKLPEPKAPAPKAKKTKAKKEASKPSETKSAEGAKA